MTFYVIDHLGFIPDYKMGVDWRSLDRREVVPAPETFDRRSTTHEEEVNKWMADRELSSPKEREAQAFSEQVFAQGEVQILAYQVMTRPVITLTPHNLIKEAVDIFLNKRFRHIPLLDEEDHVVGIISDRRVMREMIEKDIKYSDEERLIRDIMVNKVLAADQMTEIGQIAKIFIEEKIGSMPVVDKERKLLGILTRSDLLRTIVKITPPEIRI
ncbi:hypothetical protein SCG7109_BH_00010 [Chlamydiales bacterium SCGC AG-110-M15]|nr:hypothetical protein SCG7109_BH_00010 [Chlamydiales bacterium SCGC AG-110-M15]